MRSLAGTAFVLALSLGGARAADSEATASEATYGAWTLRCETAAAAATRACIMFQNLVLRTGGQPVLQFAIGIAPGAATPTVLLSLPLGISLPPGITMRIDQGKPATFPVERCEPDGCRAGMRLREATIEQLRGGESLEITFYDGERQPISMALSLGGFGDAFGALRARSAPP